MIYTRTWNAAISCGLRLIPPEDFAGVVSTNKTFDALVIVVTVALLVRARIAARAEVPVFIPSTSRICISQLKNLCMSYFLK